MLATYHDWQEELERKYQISKRIELHLAFFFKFAFDATKLPVGGRNDTFPCTSSFFWVFAGGSLEGSVDYDSLRLGVLLVVSFPKTRGFFFHAYYMYMY